MLISQLKIHNLRNIQTATFQPSERINLLYGLNGSGKTSVLESIHMLGLGRSFRTNQIRHVINTEANDLLVFAQVDPMSTGSAQPLGMSRTREGDLKVRYAGQTLSAAELASLLPVLVINSETFSLLEGSPANRRQFVDWGGFHADSAFIRLWRGFNRALKQRNSLLKCGKIDGQMRALWDRELVSFAEPLTALRAEYLERLIPEFEQILRELMGETIDIQLRFYPGWDRKRELESVLSENFEKDLRQGFTGSGPQRADLRFRVDHQDAAERLSRGQKKLVVSALKLAQGRLFYQQSQRACIYLIDDLPSELDEVHSRQFCRFLEASENQCFITCVDPALLSQVWRPDTPVARFRVANGQVEQSSVSGE